MTKKERKALQKAVRLIWDGEMAGLEEGMDIIYRLAYGKKPPFPHDIPIEELPISELNKLPEGPFKCGR